MVSLLAGLAQTRMASSLAPQNHSRDQVLGSGPFPSETLQESFPQRAWASSVPVPGSGAQWSLPLLDRLPRLPLAKAQVGSRLPPPAQHPGSGEGR